MLKEMWGRIYPFLLSGIGHVALFGILIVGIELPSYYPGEGTGEPLQAVVIDGELAEKELQLIGYVKKG